MANPYQYERQRLAAESALAEMANRRRQEPEPQLEPQPAPMPTFSEASERQGLGTSLHLLKNSLNGGELSPELGARFDQQRMASGCHELLNMIPLPWGGIRKRPGLEFISYGIEPSGASRLLPFVFSQNQSRLLEFYCAQGAESSNLRVYSGEGELLATFAALLPFGAEILHELDFCQSADVIFLAHKDLAPGKLMRYGDTDWRYEQISWLPSIQPPEWLECAATGTWPDGEKRRVTYEYVATAISAETGEESPPSEIMKCEATAPLSESWYMQCNFKCREDSKEVRIYRKSAGVFGFVGMVDDPQVIVDDEPETRPQDLGQEPPEESEPFLAFEDRNIEPDTADTPPRYKEPFKNEDERPSRVFLHQQRLGFAASTNKPLTIWLSQSGSYESMAASIPPKDDDAIEATLAAQEANKILWALSDRSGLLIGTEGGEWLMAPSEGTALTPSDLSFQPQCAYGSQSGLKPCRANGSIIFAQRGGRVVRDLGYSFQDDRYNAQDLSILSRHIFLNRKITSWAWQQEPLAILWMSLSDGTLAALTYLREHEIMAWHRHATEGFIEQVCAIPKADGDFSLFLSVLHNVNGSQKRALERLGDFTEPTAASRYLDGPNQSQFEARCIPCLPEADTPTGSTFLMLKKINSIKARVLNSAPFMARISSQDHQAGALMRVPPRGTDFTKQAIWNCALGAGWRENAKLELICDGPLPVSILALLINVECSDLSGAQG